MLNPEDKKIDNRVTILIADDHPLLRKALKDVLVTQPEFEVVAEAGDGEEATRLAQELAPNVVIMDIGMPKVNGIEATRQIKATNPDTAILVLTVYDDAEHIFSIIEAGADAYLTKRVFGNEIITAVRGAVAGETILASPGSKQIIKEVFKSQAKSLHLHTGENISAKELQILKLLANGKNNKCIAESLNVSVRTIKNYLTELFSKLRVTSRTEAVITALKSGLITLED